MELIASRFSGNSIRFPVIGFVILAVLVVGCENGDRMDPDLASATIDACGASAASGEVTNHSSSSATPVIEVEVTDAEGLLLLRASVTHPGLESGDTANWEVRYEITSGHEESPGISCEVSIPTLFRFAR